MNELPILSILILLPIVGIFFMTLIRNNNDQSSNNLKHTALWISFLNFLISLYLLFSFNQQDADFQFDLKAGQNSTRPSDKRSPLA